MNPRSVVVVDDHPLIRKGLCEAIRAEADLRVAGEAASYRDALDLLRKEQADILVLDLNLKDGNGWTLLQQLKAEGLLPYTLILSVCDEEVYAQRLLQAGARGYLMKGEPTGIVIEAIRKILAGHVAISDTMTARLLQASAKPPARSLDELSDRELQVYQMLGQGLSNKTIGERIGISPKTIGTYKARLMEKLGVRTTHELVERTKIQAHTEDKGSSLDF